MVQYWILGLEILIAILTAGLALWIGTTKSYLNERAKNAATHADIDKLVDQMSAVTEATKTIEAKISDQVWARQKRWEVQQTVLLDSLEALAAAETVLFNLVYVFSQQNKDTDSGQRRRDEVMNEYHKAISDFWRMKLAIRLVCGKAVADQYERIDHMFVRVRNRARGGGFSEIWDSDIKEIEAAKSELIRLIRVELDFDASPGSKLTLQSSGSSAAPSPD